MLHLTTHHLFHVVLVMQHSLHRLHWCNGIDGQHNSLCQIRPILVILLASQLLQHLVTLDRHGPVVLILLARSLVNCEQRNFELGNNEQMYANDYYPRI